MNFIESAHTTLVDYMSHTFSHALNPHAQQLMRIYETTVYVPKTEERLRKDIRYMMKICELDDCARIRV